MSEEEKNSEEIEIQSNEKQEKIFDESIFKDLENKLKEEQEKAKSFQDQLQRSLADYQNLEKKTGIEIEKGINYKLDKFFQKFLSIYDDFVLAKTVLSKEKINVDGLTSILKNIDSLFEEYKISPIDSLGELFDPNLHEAISVVEDPNLDDGTIIKEIRKGYISQNGVIRPAIVEISKKPQNTESKSE